MCPIIPARGRHGRLRLPAPAAHLPGAGNRRDDLEREAPKGLRLAEMLGSGTLEWEEQRMSWGTRLADGEVGDRIEDR